MSPKPHMAQAIRTIRIPLPNNPTGRRLIEDEIERLLAILDALDPDFDLEPDLDGEPGTWTEQHQNRAHCTVEGEGLEPYLAGYSGANDDREDDGDDREPGGDDEPWLGRLETMHQGAGTYSGS